MNKFAYKFNTMIKGQFAKNLVLIAGGTAFAQALGTLLSPVITRIYTPEQYGVLTVYISLLSLFAGSECFRYELGIPVSEDDESAVNVLALSIIILSLTTTFILITLIFGGEGILTGKLIFWLPLLLPFLIYYLTNNWQGINYLNRLFTIDNYKEQGFLYLLSAGRYGGGSSQQSRLLEIIWENYPIIGQGMGSQVVYDSAIFHFFSSGGLIALLLYLLILLYLFIIGMKFYIYKINRHETIFFINLLLLTILASFGSPVFTLNRSSVVLWVFVSLLLWFFKIQKLHLKKNRNSIQNSVTSRHKFF